MQEGKVEKNESPLTKRQRTTLERRKQIVEAAAVCFVEQGFHQTSIRDIAKQAGVSLGNLYNHFESKTGLIAEIAKLEAEDLVQIHALLLQEGAPLDLIDQFSAAYFAYVSRPENAVLAAEINAEVLRSPHIAGNFLKNRAQTVHLMSAVVEKVDGVFPESTAEVSEALLVLIEGTAARAAFRPEKEKEKALSALKSMTRRVLGF